MKEEEGDTWRKRCMWELTLHRHQGLAGCCAHSTEVGQRCLGAECWAAYWILLERNVLSEQNIAAGLSVCPGLHQTLIWNEKYVLCKHFELVWLQCKTNKTKKSRRKGWGGRSEGKNGTGCKITFVTQNPRNKITDIRHITIKWVTGVPLPDATWGLNWFCLILWGPFSTFATQAYRESRKRQNRELQPSSILLWWEWPVNGPCQGVHRGLADLGSNLVNSCIQWGAGWILEGNMIP